MKKKGFTLVELLVVVAVAGVIMTILAQIFFSSLRGNNKAQVIAMIKQNGQSVLDNLDKNIRNADHIVCVSSTGRTLVIVKDGVYTRYGFIYGAATTDPPSNGDIWRDNPIPDGTETEQNPNNFINRVCGFDPISINAEAPGASHILDTSAAGVFVFSGTFSRDQVAGFKEVVKINFSLQPSIESAKKILGSIDPVPFNTSVGLR